MTIQEFAEKQGQILRRTRDHLSRAKRGDVNVDLTGIEQGLVELESHNRLLLAPNAAGLGATLSEHNEAVAANAGA